MQINMNDLPSMISLPTLSYIAKSVKSVTWSRKELMANREHGGVSGNLHELEPTAGVGRTYVAPSTVP